MNTWFTSDTHFGHENIIKYCNRPFENVEQMNETLIRNFNQRIKPNDRVFFAGDFCFRNSAGGKKGEGETHKATYYQEKVNGIWTFIKGNHDRNNSLKTCIEKIVIRYGGERICIVHNPLHADKNYKYNFVGHVHERWKIRKLGDSSIMINVGVDVWNFTPVSFEEIMRDVKKWQTTS